MTTTDPTPSSPEQPSEVAGVLSEAKRALLARRLRQGAAVAATAPEGTPEDAAGGRHGDAAGSGQGAGGTPGGGPGVRRVVPVRAAGELPLSHAQERLWFLEQFAPGTAQLTIPIRVRLRGPLDADRLAAALAATAAGHDALRMRFPATGDGRPRVTVAEAATGEAAGEEVLPLTVREAAGEDAARALVEEFLAAPFDLAAGPVARALLVRLGPADHVLTIAIHHIAADGWSADLLLRELYARYDGTVPPPPEVSYADYAAWQRARPLAARDLEFWRDRLAGLEPLDLPTDRPRPPERTYSGAACAFELPEEAAAGLARLAREHRATPYMVLLAAFAALLGRYAGASDVAVGSPVAGRPAPELDRVVGCFVNMLTMRVDLSGDPSFAELLERARAVTLDALAHQDLPFEQLVAELDLPREVSRPPLFEVLLAVQNYRDGDLVPPAGLSAADFPVSSWSTRYDLELYAGDGRGGLLVHNTDLFDRETAERLTGHLGTLLARAAARPDLPLSRLDLMTDGERRLVLETWNDTATAYPGPATLHGRFEAQAARTPDALAVRCEGRSLTYAELDAAADRIARTLRRHGVRPGSVVAVCAERSPELLPGLLGVLKAGAAYLPVDPEYPAERVAFMLADAAPAALLTQRGLRAELPPSAALVLDLDDPDAWTGGDDAPLPQAGPGDVAYVIYTSGSTGRPKGVPNTHGGIANRLDWMQERFGLDAADVVLQKTPLSFDVSVWELFWPLRCGARLTLAAPGGHRDAAYLRELIAAEGVTTAHFVPSMLAVFLAEDGAAGCGSLRRVICSGEELPADLARRCLAALPAAELHNLYGPTEAAVDVSAWHCTPDALAGLARVPIGGPIANTALYVLDAALRPAPVGVPGELHIGGAGLATGYLNRPALTAERFVPDPYGPPGARLYRTGDLARWRPDGTLEFLGRLDDQVKLRGLRIEPGEIEAALRALPAVRDAAVIVREDRLVAYVTPGEAEPDRSAGPDHAALRAALKRTLPDHMVPAAFVTLDALPLGPSGKLDRRRLPAPVAARDAGVALVAPATPTESALAAIWRDLLGLDAVGVHDDFFDLGGHSLLATQVVARLRRDSGLAVAVMDVFKHRTIRELAALADTPAERRGPRALLHRLTPASRRAPELTYVCVPYGGGSAVVYQPLADALPDSAALWSVAIPGHDVGVEEERLPFEELAAACVAEILEKVAGPIVLYGHCGVGSALAVELARRLEAAGREPAAVYIGGIFPFARPRGALLSRLTKLAEGERLRGDQRYVNWLISMGLDMGEVDPGQARRIVRNMRRDSREAEEFYTRLLESGAERLRAPVITVAGTEDPATDYYQERYREWHFLTPVSAVVVLAEAGHFFLKYRARELAGIVTTVHRELEAPVTGRRDGATWWLHGVSRAGEAPPPAGPRPGLARFLTVAASQLVSATGSALTEFAVPLWIYTTTGSVAQFALMAVAGLVPGLLAAPVAGAVIDRADRRRVMLAGDAAALAIQLAFGTLLWTGNLSPGLIYPLLGCLSVALTFQRIAYFSAVPQLVPKLYLGHANGVLQLGNGTAQLLVPLFAVGLMAGIGLGGILVLDVLSYAVAVAVLLVVRFPRTLPWRRRESVKDEILGGLRYSLGHRGFVAMLLFFVVMNVFLAPLLLMFSPLVLSFAGLGDVGRVSFLAGAGTLAGALVMTVWGGPRRLRLRGVLLCALALGFCCAVTGLRADLAVIAAGACGMTAWVTVLNGIYTTIVQVKVPQRFHGRVFAMNTLIAWSTLPIGYGLVAPYAAALLDPLLLDGGPLAPTVGALIGTGPGRGIGLMYVLSGLVIMALALVATRVPALARFDREVPDTVADDLVGLRALGVPAADPLPPGVTAMDAAPARPLDRAGEPR
ncbi:amino acid adenylation domain-containing protein [Actinomadura sp. ATCC 31491]|uniref:Amino acid adenylation domain-containing protein n=1 Tax=Actinomadura luzonensis TaxID=2805427 RepID=A0ABT0FUW4_9ACTN|nr:non-ribosomal peptide synthetase/MFS transporter [Actinomadura luzonensis]MCK2215701.1 amino acid adenylation domain-containing protein [Actinomadura luzonensis]